MKQEDKELLLKDLCARLPYGIKILHTGWDYDSDTDFDTVETLIGIDDRFIYAVWDKTGDREKHCLSVSNWKPYLRPMSSMTEEERKEVNNLIKDNRPIPYGKINNKGMDNLFSSVAVTSSILIDWLNAHYFDYRSLIPKGLAIEAPEGMY
jgi:hypothetical protein